MKIIEPSSTLINYNKVIDESQQKQAESWLLTELYRAEKNFGHGNDIDKFAKNYKLGEFSK